MAKVDEKLKKEKKNKEYAAQGEDIMEIRKEIGRIERKMDEQERKERKNKIVIRGLRVRNKKAKGKMEKFMEKEFEVVREINTVETRGRAI